ncbi:MAG TPA: FxDxF family PEP-CTERM protein [Roseateles sp.]|nr:FxDxF family PEP-CTERM protein [Roseateles sp.]
MKKLLATALFAGLGLATSAHAALTSGSISCSSGTTNVAFIDCAGSFVGNLSGSLSADQIAMLNSSFGDKGFSYNSSLSYSMSNGAGNGVFSDDGKDFSLNFDAGTKATGLFVIGLKQANAYSFYLFDGGTQGINQLSFDVKGVVSGPQAGGLSHAVFLGNVQTAAVPEPETYALMLAGLAAVGFVARRRARSA